MFREDSARLPTDLEAIHRYGFPIDGPELKARIHRVADADNAAPLYRKAFEQLRKLPWQQLNALNGYYGRTKNPKVRAKQQKIWIAKRAAALASFQPIKQIVIQAARLPACDLGVDWARLKAPYMAANLHVLLPEEGPFWEIGDYLQAEVREEIRVGNVKGALDDIGLLFSMARQAPEYGTVLGQYWTSATQQSALFELWEIVRIHYRESEVLERAEALASEAKLPNLYKSIAATFVEGRNTIQRINSFGQIGIWLIHPLERPSAALLQSPGVKEAFDARFVKTYLGLIASLPKDPEDWTGIRDAIETADHRIAGDHSLDGYAARLMRPDFELSPSQFGMVQALARMTLISIGMIRRFRATGKWPETLPPMGKLSTDPFSKKPFHYHRLADGFSLSGVPWPVPRGLPKTFVLRDDGDRTCLRFTLHPRPVRIP